MKEKSIRTYKKKTHCYMGHEFTPENMYVYKTVTGHDRRICKECNKARALKYYARSEKDVKRRALKRYYELKGKKYAN